MNGRDRRLRGAKVRQAMQPGTRLTQPTSRVRRSMRPPTHPARAVRFGRDGCAGSFACRIPGPCLGGSPSLSVSGGRPPGSSTWSWTAGPASQPGAASAMSWRRSRDELAAQPRW